VSTPKLRRRLLAVLVATSAAALAPAAEATPRIDRTALDRAPTFAPGEAIVRFERGTDAGERLAARRAADVAFDRSLLLPQTQVVEGEGSVAETIRDLERQPDVVYAQPNYRYHALAMPPPDDSLLTSLWGLSDPNLPDRGVNATAAWSAALGGGQVIAVVDTGVDLSHPDLVANLWTNPGETANGLDDGDPNGEVDDVHGYDFVDDDGVPDDFNFHGTHIAGTAAASAGNGIGVAGVAPDAGIMAVRVLDGDGSGFSDTIADGIRYAGESGATVINMSLGGPADGGAGDQAMEDAIAFAASRDVVVVAAAGNSNSDNDDPDQASTPCALPNTNLICVAATDRSGAKSSFSSYGATTVDVGAPGRGIVSAEADYDTVFADGFDAGLGQWTAPLGTTAWGPSAVRSVGSGSAADSPSGGYAPDANAQLVKATGLNLMSERGCRMHFHARYDIEDGFDELLAGAVSGSQQDVTDPPISGTSLGLFEATEVSISDLDGLSGVFPAFALFSDGEIELDGAYVDDVRVMCRGDNLDPAGSYTSFNGTSMATPHVAGVVALARSAAPAATAAQTIAAVHAGTRPLPSLAGRTVTGGLVDACLAVDGLSVGELDCGTYQPPAPGPDQDPPAPSPGPVPPATVAPAPPSGLAPLRAADLRRSPGRVRVTASRRFSYRFDATPGLSGDVRLATRQKVLVSARARRLAHLSIDRKHFEVPAGGHVRLRLRLSRKEMRLLRGNERLALWAAVTVRAADGRTAFRRKRLLLLPPRR
jgi:thermitase